MAGGGRAAALEALYGPEERATWLTVDSRPKATIDDLL
jgi:hypothetical protein